MRRHLVRRLWSHRKPGGDHRGAANGVDRVGPRQAERTDHEPAEGGTDDHRERAQPVLERERAAQPAAVDQVWDDRRNDDVLEGDERGQQGRQRVQHPDRGIADRGRRRQRRRRQHEAHLVEEQQLAPVDPVGDGAAQERGGDERRQLDGSEEPDQQRRPRLDVHLVGQRDERRLRAEARQEAPHYDEPEVAALAQRSEIGSQPREAQAGVRYLRYSLGCRLELLPRAKDMTGSARQFRASFLYLAGQAGRVLLDDRRSPIDQHARVAVGAVGGRDVCQIRLAATPG